MANTEPTQLIGVVELNKMYHVFNCVARPDNLVILVKRLFEILRTRIPTEMKNVLMLIDNS